MKSHTKVVWLGYASIVLSPVWGVGIVAAVSALRIARANPLGVATDRRIQRDLRGGLLLARAGLVLNIIVLAMICWMFLSTRLL